MLPYRDSAISRIVLAIFFLILIGYGYYELRGILFGPKITVTSDIQEVHEPFITIQGRADHIASLRMNGKAVSVTENGAFEEPYLLSPGLNRIILDAEDTYGKRSQRVVLVVYTPEEGSEPAAVQTTSTTAASSTPLEATSTPLAPQTQ